jgi:hypothetical protein
MAGAGDATEATLNGADGTRAARFASTGRSV